MQKIFERTSFPKASGGDLYEWKEAETTFNTPSEGVYKLEVVASAKNAEQKGETDDDDMRGELDGYAFGKYEVHEEKVAWRGFNTASSWDGASLKGYDKTVNYIVRLQEGEHIFKFFADGTPKISSFTVFKLEENEEVEIEMLKPSSPIECDRKGIPLLSIIMLGVKPLDFSIASTVHSAAQKETTDGDNLKIVVNGKIVQNTKAPTSLKYKNYYFSGDLNLGKSEVITLPQDDFEFLEDSVEFWFDQEPSVYVEIELGSDQLNWLSKQKNAIKRNYYVTLAESIAAVFEKIGWGYSHDFLLHSLQSAPSPRAFGNRTKLVQLMKRDVAYKKLQNIVLESLEKDILDGQVHLGDPKKNLDVTFGSLTTLDLALSIHGVHKVDFTATKNDRKKCFEVSMMVHDVYDFSTMQHKWNEFYLAPYVFLNNQIDSAEANRYIKNFDITIAIHDTIPSSK